MTTQNVDHGITIHYDNTVTGTYPVGVRAVSHRNKHNVVNRIIYINTNVPFNSKEFLKKMTDELNGCNIGSIATFGVNTLDKKNPMVFIPANQLDKSLQIQIFNEFVNQLGEHQEDTDSYVTYFGISPKKLRGFPRTKPSLILLIKKVKYT